MCVCPEIQNIKVPLSAQLMRVHMNDVYSLIYLFLFFLLISHCWQNISCADNGMFIHVSRKRYIFGHKFIIKYCFIFNSLHTHTCELRLWHLLHLVYLMPMLYLTAILLLINISELYDFDYKISAMKKYNTCKIKDILLRS